MEFGVRGKDLGELERLLGLFEAGKLSGALTVARLLLVSRDVSSIERWLLEHVAKGSAVRHELLHLIERHRDGCQCVAALRERRVESAAQEPSLRATPSLATHETDASGRGALAESITRELVEQFESWGLLGTDRHTLGLSCGAGRMQAALSPRVALAAGVDASRELIARARWCSSRLHNTRHEVAEGHDLSAFGDASFQLVYAVDPAPSIVGSSDARVTNILAEVARVLAPSGDFVIVEPAPSASEGGAALVERQAQSHGFELVASGERPFRCRAGVSYHLRRNR